MKLEVGLLSSRFGLRILFLFVFCTVLPLSILATISFTQVTGQLEEQGFVRLKRDCKVTGMYVIERLLSISQHMRLIADNVTVEPTGGVSQVNLEAPESLRHRYTWLAVRSADGVWTPLLGTLKNPPQLTTQEWEAIPAGRTVLQTHAHRSHPSRILMGMAMTRESPRGPVLFAEINPLYVWTVEGEKIAAPDTGFCLLDTTNRLLVSSFPVSDPPPTRLREIVDTHEAGILEL